MKSEWNMPRRAEACAACRREFAAGEPVLACLFESGTGYDRRDLCLACAGPGQAPAGASAPGDVPPLATWRTRRAAPTARPAPALDRDALYRIFERTASADDPRHLQFRFVLALLLWRKRVLRLERTAADAGQDVWEFTAPADGVLHHVLRPELDESQLERLSQELEGLLAGRSGTEDFPLPASDKEPSDAPE